MSKKFRFSGTVTPTESHPHHTHDHSHAHHHDHDHSHGHDHTSTQTHSPLDHVDAQISQYIESHKTPILEKNEQRTRWVVYLTVVTMVVELLVGWWSNSMALTADGWHMASHTGALGLTLFGYSFARRYDGDERFSFGTGKVFALTGFASAIALAVAGVLVAMESFHHMLHPEDVEFTTAMWVAIVGLVINLLSALLLSQDQSSDMQHVGHSHNHSHGHSHSSNSMDSAGSDHNLQGAYLHVLADALTSVLAILALALGKWMGWTVLDPLMGVVGGLVILRWAVQLCKDTGWVLLGAQPNLEIMQRVREHFTEQPNMWITDLHIWDLGLSRYACVLSVVDAEPKPVDYYKTVLRGIAPFAHINVEIHPLEQECCGENPST